jgi:hypothetical protein
VKLPPYVPPTGDEPLDAIEQALVKALTAIIVRQLREEATVVHARPSEAAGNLPDQLLDTEELARCLKNVSPRTVERWRTTGQGPVFVRVGRRVLYRRSAIQDWLNQQSRSHTNDTGGKKRGKVDAGPNQNVKENSGLSQTAQAHQQTAAAGRNRRKA